MARQLLNALRRPGPINVGRPVNEVGARSFHFSTTSCAKDSSSGSVAGAHQSYLERGGPDAAQNQQYLERGAPGGGPVVASFGNLGRTFEERLDFWNAVTSAEHAPASFAVASLHFDRGPEFWTEVGSDRAAPEALRAALASGSRKIVLRDVVSTALLMAYLTSFPATNKPPVVISPGRGGRIQTRVVAELPHEVSDRRAVRSPKRSATRCSARRPASDIGRSSTLPTSITTPGIITSTSPSMIGRRGRSPIRRADESGILNSASCATTESQPQIAAPEETESRPGILPTQLASDRAKTIRGGCQSRTGRRRTYASIRPAKIHRDGHRP